MAGKEERIWIECELPLKKGMTDSRRLLTITRQEAIEVMAKAIFSKSGFPKDCIWEKINEETKTAFRLYAREALNALLEGVKNEK